MIEELDMLTNTLKIIIFKESLNNAKELYKVYQESLKDGSSEDKIIYNKITLVNALKLAKSNLKAVKT